MLMHAVQPPEPSAREDELDRPIWGAANIGKEIGRNTRQAFHLLETGQVPGTKVGRQWVSTRRRLRTRLAIIGEAA
jgi:hypothetical protein